METNEGIKQPCDSKKTNHYKYNLLSLLLIVNTCINVDYSQFIVSNNNQNFHPSPANP